MKLRIRHFLEQLSLITNYYKISVLGRRWTFVYGIYEVLELELARSSLFCSFARGKEGGQDR